MFILQVNPDYPSRSSLARDKASVNNYKTTITQRLISNHDEPRSTKAKVFKQGVTDGHSSLVRSLTRRATSRIKYLEATR